MSNKDYATGRYGVVDMFHRNIWFNHDDETIAHEIRKTFASKVGLVVYDLTIFENFVEDPPVIDSSCCLDWQIDFVFNESLTKISTVLGLLEKTQSQHHRPILINSKTEMLLSTDRQKELQKQIMLYAHILQETKIHRAISLDTVKEYQTRLLFGTDLDYAQIQLNFYQSLNAIFASVLYIDEINQKLRKLADNLLCVPTGFAASTAAEILSVTGGIYA